MTFDEKKKKALSYIGFARRCGRCAIGTEQVIAEVRRCGAGVCVALAADASDRTKKQIRDKCAFHGARLLALEFGGEELANAVGKDMNVSAVAVTEKKLAAALISLDTDGTDIAPDRQGAQLNERDIPHGSGSR